SHAGDVEALFTVLLDAAPVDVLDLRRGQADAVDEGLHQVGRQVIRADVAVHAFFRVGPADRGTDGLDDDGRTHGGSSGEQGNARHGKPRRRKTQWLGSRETQGPV